VKELLKRYTWSRYLVERLASTQLSEGQQLSLVSHVTGAASTVVSVVVDAIVVLFSALYFGISPDIYVRGIISLVPENRSDRMREVFEASSQTLRYWLMGQAVAMLTIGTTVAIGLWIAGVPLAFLLGVIAGLLDFIPYLGPTAAAIPGILIGLTESPLTGVYALLVYLVVQQLENHLVVPLVQKQTVWLPPALVVLAVIVFGLLFGVLGLLVATPLTAVIVVWVKMLYVHDILGKPVDVVGKPANMG
jgi:predicted PurR-regulated permease PerM